MPAPENLQTQTPGEATTTAAPEPEYSAKHNGGGRYRIWSLSSDDWFSDFVVTGDDAKAKAEVEAERLNAGGEPYIKPEEQAAAAPAQAAAATTTTPAPRPLPVLTDEGWLCPEPNTPAKE